MCMPEQCFCRKVYKITKSEIFEIFGMFEIFERSLRCFQDGVTTGKLKDLSIAKQYCLIDKLDSIKSTKEQHACSGW